MQSLRRQAQPQYTTEQPQLFHRTYLISYLEFKSYSSCYAADHSLTNNTVYNTMRCILNSMLPITNSGSGVWSLFPSVLLFIPFTCLSLPALLEAHQQLGRCNYNSGSAGGMQNYCRAQSVDENCTSSLLPRQKFPFLALMKKESREEEQEKTYTWG